MSRAGWWLDYIEKELEPAMRAQMKSILKRSRKDQELVEEIQATRDLVASADVVDSEMSDDFFAKMEQKIMASVEAAEIKQPSAKDRALDAAVRKVSQNRKTLARSAALAGIMMTAFLTYSFLSSMNLHTQWDVNQEIAHHLQEDPSEFSALMSYQNEHDFFVDVASQSLDHLTKEQFETLLGSAKARVRVTR